MSAAPDLLRRLRDVGATLARDGDRLLLRAGAAPVPAAIIAALRDRKGELLDLVPQSGCAVWHDEAFEERAAIVEEGAGVSRAWAEAFAVLDLCSRPPACSDARWRQIIDDAGLFLDRFGNEAAQLGWEAIDVFGIPPNDLGTDPRPTGLVPLIRGGSVEAIRRDRATVRMPSGGLLVYLRRPQPGRPSDWEYHDDTSNHDQRDE